MSNYRDAARDPAFFDGLIDARAILPFMVLLLYMSWLTFTIALLTSILFVILSMNKITLAILHRKIRSLARGKDVSGRPFWMKKRRS